MGALLERTAGSRGGRGTIRAGGGGGGAAAVVALAATGRSLWASAAAGRAAGSAGTSGGLGWAGLGAGRSRTRSAGEAVEHKVLVLSWFVEKMKQGKAACERAMSETTAVQAGLQHHTQGLQSLFWPPQGDCQQHTEEPHHCGTT
ncbi:homeotic protein female sterile-like [Molothrus aeneus]|uniref:homeotic protein female sterile-like n=1 Tax=Molothrus aeneus TaxID=84833 RepID=UPI00345A3EE5